MPSSTFTNMFPPKAKWSLADVPDLSGKVAFVTGGTGGIGLQIGKQLAAKGAKVYLTGRSKSKTEQIVQSIRGDVHAFELDLADLSSTKAAGQRFLQQESKLDMLFLNAGVMFCDKKLTTADGFDLQFGTNVLGHYQLTKELLPALLASGKQTGDARIITVSSMGHLFSKGIDYSIIKADDRSKISEKEAYFNSKLANIMCAIELHNTYASHGIVSTSLHPGNIKTDLSRHSTAIEAALTNWMLYPVELGVLTPLYAGTSPLTAKSGGKYFIPWAREGQPSNLVHDQASRTTLMSFLEANVIS